jgi:TPR repeat protein
MRGLLALVLGGLLALGAVPTVAHATPAISADLPVPRLYPQGTLTRARTNKSAEQVARELASADAAAADCEAGRTAGCSALGLAYQTGAGRPQNRPVAELIYRKACNAADADGCYRLAALLRTIDDDESIDPEAVQLFARACRLGSLDACADEADDLARGVRGPPDLAGADAKRRAACAAGGTFACLTLGKALMASERTPAERAKGLALIEQQCRAGNGEACSESVTHWRGEENGDGPQTQAYLELGCTARLGWACTALGDAALDKARRGLNPDARERARADALGWFDRACAIDAALFCHDAARLREEPLAAARCESGDAAGCAALGALVGPSGAGVEERARALALLGPACERGIDTVCLPAAWLAFEQARATGADVAPQVEAYLAQSCAAGTRDACEELADELARGTRLTQDLARAGVLYVPQCEAGRETACKFLEEQALTDPDAPLTLASAAVQPVPTPEEEAELRRAFAEDLRRKREEDRAKRCTTTTVTYEGVSYIDTQCDRTVRVIGGGFVAGRGDAPWQALLWRPEVLNRKRLTPDQRVLCGGALIREGWILTAAHCLKDEGGVSVLGGGHEVRLGLANPLVDEGFSFPIVRIEPHPAFDRDTFAFDIALVQYDPKRARRGAEVLPRARIRLDPQPLAARRITTGTPAYTFGWGRTALTGGERPDRLRGARLALRDAAGCTAITRFTDIRRDSAMCASEASGPRGGQACFGDSGGPLISYIDPDKVPTVIGVVSAGIKCGTTGVPSRFTRVAHPEVQKWLDRVLGGARAR